MYTTTTTKAGDKARLYQFRFDHDALNPMLTDMNILRNYCSDDMFLHVGRETSVKTKKLHYHAIILTEIKKCDLTEKLKKFLKPDAQPSQHAIKLYNSKHFNNGETFGYYIGYCAKGHDPIKEVADSETYVSLYDEITCKKGSDEYFKSFIKKRLNSDSSDLAIREAICDWYIQQATQHNILICDQRFWQIKAMLSPADYKKRMMAQMANYALKN